jgi:hypothetical protein
MPTAKNESSPASRSAALLIAAAFALLAGGCDLTADSRPSPRQQCRQVAEHVIDLQLGGAELVAADADLAAHRDNLRASIEAAYLAHCETARDAASPDCAPGAPDLDAFRACDPDFDPDTL